MWQPKLSHIDRMFSSSFARVKTERNLERGLVMSKANGHSAKIISLSLILGQSLPANSASAESASPSYSYKSLEKVLNQMDRPSAWHAEYKQMAPPASAIPGPQGEARYSYRSPNSIDRTFHTFFPWRGATGAPLPAPAAYGNYAVSGSAGVSGAAAPGGNPFGLSPFGILHYLWDPTVYTSSANPVSLVEVRSDMQVAQQQSALAQSAARRAKYAATAAERQQAAEQARQYAQAARAAAQRAQMVAQAGSSNPADVAALAEEQANQAETAARQAGASSDAWRW